MEKKNNILSGYLVSNDANKRRINEIQRLKEKKSGKLFLRVESKIKTFSDKQKLMEFIIIRLSFNKC